MPVLRTVFKFNVENLGKTLRYQTPLLIRAADGSRTHVPGLEGEYNSRYTTAALTIPVTANKVLIANQLHHPRKWWIIKESNF